jgi:hypothetical protein
MTTATASASPPAVYRVTTTGLLNRFAPQLMLALIFGVLAGLLIAIGLTRPEADTMAPGLIVALVALGFVAWPFLAGVPSVRRVEVSDDGLAWEDGAGRHRIAWDDIAAIRRTPKLAVNGFLTEGNVTLALADGRTVVFDFSLDGYDELADLLQRYRAARLLPGLLAALERGPLTFGPVTLERHGIEYRGLSRPWTSFEYAVDSGSLVLVPAGRQFGWNDRVEVRLADVPDAVALVAVMAEVGKPPVHASRTLPASAWGDVI